MSQSASYGTAVCLPFSYYHFIPDTIIQHFLFTITYVSPAGRQFIAVASMYDFLPRWQSLADGEQLLVVHNRQRQAVLDLKRNMWVEPRERVRRYIKRVKNTLGHIISIFVKYIFIIGISNYQIFLLQTVADWGESNAPGVHLAGLPLFHGHRRWAGGTRWVGPKISKISMNKWIRWFEIKTQIPTISFRWIRNPKFWILNHVLNL